MQHFPEITPAAHHNVPRPDPVRIDAVSDRLAKLDALILLLNGHRDSFQHVIDLADAAPAGINASILADLANKARGGIRQIDATLADPHVTGTHTDLGAWGPNGRGPGVADLVRRAEFHAARADDAARKVA